MHPDARTLESHRKLSFATLYQLVGPLKKDELTKVLSVPLVHMHSDDGQFVEGDYEEGSQGLFLCKIYTCVCVRACVSARRQTSADCVVLFLSR